jgi:hypothetical protein
MTMTLFNFNLENDYAEEFRLTVEEMMKNPEEDRDLRMETVQILIDDYVDQTGERPKNRDLTRLGHYILSEELKDKRPNKVQEEEHPILSNSQVIRRQANEAGFDYAEMFISQDGKDFNASTRRKRTKYENMFVDGDLKKLRPQDKIIKNYER